ncbi:MAG: MFS transporter [Sulfolobales archaeon]
MSFDPDRTSGVVIILILIYVLVMLIRSANALFIFSLTQSYELKTLSQGIIQGAYSLTEALSGFIAGFLYEYLGSVRSLILSTILLVVSYTLSQIIYSLNLDPMYLLIPQIIGGFSAAFIIVSSIALLAEETIRFTFRGRLIGAGGLETSNLGGYAIGFLIAGFLEIRGSSLLRGFITPLISVILALSLSIYLSSRIHVERRSMSTGRELISVERRSLNLIPMWSGVALILGVAFISPRILKNMISIETSSTESGLGHLFVIAILLLSAGILAGSYVSSILGRVRALGVGVFSAPLLLILLGYLVPEIIRQNMFHILSSYRYVSLLVLTALLGLLSLTIPPTLLALLAEYTDRSRFRGPASGVYVTTLGLGIFIGNILGGYIFDHYGFQILTILLATIFTPLGVSTYVLVKRSHESRW